ncbi:hypothetical protein L1049_022491 [Liquidambar formosana]|uniref:Uncharacterized protein n=1 Tax=Liquidambar formosana TaxID=63359 RepID=A0AAP0WP38_LIQFO
MMEESRKRQGNDSAGEVAVKRQRTPATSDDNDDDDDILAWLSADEDTMVELMNLLEEEITSPFKVKFIDDPYSSPLIFQSSSLYVTINGNEESCGSSFSDSESSVMASIDMGGINKGGGGGGTEALLVGPAAEDAGAWVDEEQVAGYWAEDGEGAGKGSNGCDWSDWDDDELARFLRDDLF